LPARRAAPAIADLARRIAVPAAARHRIRDVLADLLPLVLRNRREQVRGELPGDRGEVDVLRERVELAGRALPEELREELELLQVVAGEAVHLVDDQVVH